MTTIRQQKALQDFVDRKHLAPGDGKFLAWLLLIALVGAAVAQWVAA